MYLSWICFHSWTQAFELSPTGTAYASVMSPSASDAPAAPLL